MVTTVETRKPKVNLVGLSKADYTGKSTTLCAGCGHNSISSQIISAAYELSLRPHEVIKLSGIGCSSKSPAYFMNRAHGFNGLHGRMPSAATGAILANHTMRAIGMSGDGDTANIGMGQFKHLVRRNVPMVYIVANNGVYGLTKGQFSATADQGLELKKGLQNRLPPIDICLEALVGGASFVARSFAGDPRQLSTLLKAALAHKGTAVLDVISPCVTFNNKDESPKSYAWGREHEEPLHDLTYVPERDEIVVSYEPGEITSVAFADGSSLRLKKIEVDHDPTSRLAALTLIEESRTQGTFVTGLIYVNPTQPTFVEISGLGTTPLARLTPAQMRPAEQTLRDINARLA